MNEFFTTMTFVRCIFQSLDAEWNQAAATPTAKAEATNTTEPGQNSTRLLDFRDSLNSFLKIIFHLTPRDEVCIF
jgi:hypothetical protein